MNYIIRIFENKTYHLYKKGDTQATPFREVLRETNINKSFPLERKFDAGWERVGEINIRGLLMLPKEVNSVYWSLRKSRGESYTWAEFCKAREKKLSKKRKS